MTLSADLVKKLSKTFAPETLIHDRFRGTDLAFKTDKQGNPVQLFVGKRKAGGTIAGERFVRTLKYSADGAVLKDHWEKKGTAS